MRFLLGDQLARLGDPVARGAVGRGSGRGIPPAGPVLARGRVFVRDVGKQHLQVHQQGADLLRFEQRRLDLKSRAARWNQGGIGLDLKLDFVPRRFRARRVRARANFNGGGVARRG